MWLSARADALVADLRRKVVQRNTVVPGAYPLVQPQLTYYALFVVRLRRFGETHGVDFAYDYMADAALVTSTNAAELCDLVRRFRGKQDIDALHELVAVRVCARALPVTDASPLLLDVMPDVDPFELKDGRLDPAAFDAATKALAGAKSAARWISAAPRVRALFPSLSGHDLVHEYYLAHESTPSRDFIAISDADAIQASSQWSAFFRRDQDRAKFPPEANLRCFETSNPPRTSNLALFNRPPGTELMTVELLFPGKEKALSSKESKAVVRPVLELPEDRKVSVTLARTYSGGAPEVRYRMWARLYAMANGYFLLEGSGVSEETMLLLASSTDMTRVFGDYYREFVRLAVGYYTLRSFGSDEFRRELVTRSEEVRVASGGTAKNVDALQRLIVELQA